MDTPVKVFKLAGAALSDSNAVNGVISSIRDKIEPGNCFFIHGGGGEITYWLDKFNIESTFVGGQRVTCSQALKVVEMVLSGRVNKLIVSALESAGYRAAGISGRDGNTAVAEILDEKLGCVGEVKKVDISLINTLMGDNFIPVVSPLSESTRGKVLNVNADFFASALAAAAGADELNFITSTGGVLKEEKLIKRIKSSGIQDLIDSGVVSEGMVPKLIASRKAIDGGVKKVKMLNFKGKQGTEIL